MDYDVNDVEISSDEKVVFDISQEDESDESVSCRVLDVILINKHPNLQGFGLDISGGKDRPYTEDDNGIFISAVRAKGLAEKSGDLEVGDKILKVNGTCVLSVNHDEAVKLFIADKGKVELRIQKGYGLLLRAAALTPSPTPSAGHVTPTSEKSLSPKKESNTENNSSLSISGFVIGVAIGCICVVLLKRYLVAQKT